MIISKSRLSISDLAIGGITFGSVLAWNEVIRTIVLSFYPRNQPIRAMLMYVVIVTICGFLLISLITWTNDYISTMINSNKSS